MGVTSISLEVRVAPMEVKCLQEVTPICQMVRGVNEWFGGVTQ